MRRRRRPVRSCGFAAAVVPACLHRRCVVRGPSCATARGAFGRRSVPHPIDPFSHRPSPSRGLSSVGRRVCEAPWSRRDSSLRPAALLPGRPACRSAGPRRFCGVSTVLQRVGGCCARTAPVASTVSVGRCCGPLPLPFWWSAPRPRLRPREVHVHVPAPCVPVAAAARARPACPGGRYRAAAAAGRLGGRRLRRARLRGRRADGLAVGLRGRDRDRRPRALRAAGSPR